MFRNREDAGRQLADALSRFAERPDVVVYGIPRGGVVVAAQVARQLHVPLDVVIAAKVTSPGFSEYAIGAVAPDGEVSVNPGAGFSAGQIREMAEPAHQLVARRMRELRSPLTPQVAGRTAIVVDDGLATGLTAIAAVDYLHRLGAAEVVLAVPVAPPDTVEALRRHAEEVVVLEEPQGFSAVGQFYENFGQTSDDEVVRLLRESHVGHE